MKNKSIALIMCALFLTGLLMPLTIFAEESNQDIINADPNQIAEWKFDEGIGQSVADSSGNGNDGTLGADAGVNTDDPTWIMTGIGGNALDFDGSNDYVTCGTTLNGTVFTSLTAQAWINPENTTGPRYIFYDGSDGEFVIWQNGNACGITAKINGVAEKWATAANSIEFNRWQMVTGVFTGSELLVFVNGVLRNSTSVPANGLFNPVGNYYPTIGAWCDASSNHDFYFDGAIDEVRVWDKALNSTAIMDLFATKSFSYNITNLSQLQNMNLDLNGDYVLMNDIDASETENWNGDQGFIPIGNNTNRFNGTLQGAGYTISSLTINRTTEDYIGLFGYTNLNATIKNVSLASSDVTGDMYVGNLVGYNNLGTVTDCTVSGTISGTSEIGGLIGDNSGSVTNSYNIGYTTGGGGRGGLIGSNLATGTVTTCFSTGNNTGTSNAVGGLIGYNQGSVTDSYSTSITFATGQNVGGLLGSNIGGTITRSYCTGSVTGVANVGGMVGTNTGTFVDSHWDNETSGRTTSGGGSGNTTAEMMNQTTFVGWDFTNTWFSVNGSTRPFLRMEWDTEIRNSHQLQLMQMDLTADYTLANDIDLSDIVEPAQMWGTNLTSGKGFKPVGDETESFTGSLEGNGHVISDLNINRPSEKNVSLLGKIFTPATIANLTLTDVKVSGGQHTGALAGYSFGGIIKDCSAAGEIWGYGIFVGGLIGYNILGSVDRASFDGIVTTSVNYAGGLMGRSTGQVTNSTSSGVVDGLNWVGGLIGDTIGTGFVESCTSTSTVSGGTYVGGLLGVNGRPIGNSSTFGDVSGGNQVGGLVGYNSATITNCTSTGNATAIGAGDYLGGLVGRNEGGTLTDCHSTGNTSGDWYLGGFIGYSTGSITNCTSTGTVSGTVAGGSQGGFIGENSGPIMNCSSTGNASGGDVSGFIEINYGPITNCHSTGNVNATGMGIGGFVGLNYDTITTCYSTGNTIGVEDVGGFAGDNIGGTITKCFSTGDVTGTSGVNSYAGGFIGVNDASGQIMDCYSTGNAIGAGNYNGGFVARNYNSITNCYSIGNASGGSNTGGFLGFNSTGTTTDCFWDMEYSGTIPSDGGTPKNTAEMKQQATFDPPWDFATIWGIYEYNTYPFLQAISPTYVPDADLEITIDGTPEPCNVGDVLMYTVMVTNNGPDISVNPVVNITLPTEVTWLDDSQSIGPPTGQYLEAAIGNLDNGESGGVFINVSVDSYAATITATARIDNVTKDSNQTNNIDWANTTLNRAPNAVDDNYNVDEDSGPNTLDVLGDDTDLDGDELTIIAVTQGAHGTVTIIDAGKNVTYEPDADYVGSDTFIYTIDDGNGGNDIGTVTIDVNNINDAPVITTTDVTTATEDSLYSVDYNATDIDPSDALTWSLETDAGWLSIHTTMGVLSGTPTNDDVGTFDVSVKVDDSNGGIDWSNFTLTVSNTNDAPVITTTDVTTATEDVLYSVDYDATDIDPSDTLTWSLETDAGWLSIVATTGVLSGTPTNADVGTFWVNVSVSDGNGGTDRTHFALTVSNTNDAPVISTTTAPDGTEGQLYSLQVNATDADGDSLIWSLTSNATWLTINTTGGLSGTPTSAGTFWANVVVDDGNGGTDSGNLTLIIASSGTTTPTDTDGDGTPDDEDAFPTDPAASVDTDGDGDPDSWNPGYTADDSTTGLKEDLDDDNDGILDVDDDNPLTADGDASSNTWLYLVLILVIVAIIGAIAYLKMSAGKGGGPSFEVEPPVEDAPVEEPASADEPSLEGEGPTE